jgi:hypothetical protein
MPLGKEFGMSVQKVAGRFMNLVTIVGLHRAGRYDRMSTDVLKLTAQPPLGVQDFVRKNFAAFTSPVKGVV